MKLTLKREHLAELAPEQLAAVVGAAIPTLPIRACLPEELDTIEPTRCACP